MAVHSAEPDTSRSDEVGGGIVEYPTESMHEAGTGITGTASRIRSIGQDVGNISLDGQSFGALNEQFAATARDHVLTARQHVDATANEVDAAAYATHSTANSYLATEQDNAQRLTDIQNASEQAALPPTRNLRFGRKLANHRIQV